MDNKKRNLSSNDDCNVEEYTRNEHCMHSKFLGFCVSNRASSKFLLAKTFSVNLSCIHSSRLRNEGKNGNIKFNAPERKKALPVIRCEKFQQSSFCLVKLLCKEYQACLICN